jgi:hypothetical protein
MKWLALAAASRFKQKRIVNGLRRSRERSYSETGTLNPALLENADTRRLGDLLMPHTLIKETMPDGGEVWLELSSSVSLSERGAPQLTHWRAMACDASLQATERREAVEERRLKDLAASRKNKSQIQSMRKKIANKLAADSIKEDLFAEVLSEDLDDLTDAVMNKINLTVYPSPVEKKSIQQIIRKYYLEMRDIYDYYRLKGLNTAALSGGKKKRATGLMKNDLINFITDSKCVSSVNIEQLARKIVHSYYPVATRRQKEEDAGAKGPQVLYFPAFVDTVLQIYQLKVEVNIIDKNPSLLFDRIRVFMVESILPLCESLDVGIARVDLYVDEHLKLLNENRDTLRSIFNEYATIEAEPALSLEAFRDLCTAYHLIHSESQEKQSESKRSGDLFYAFS